MTLPYTDPALPSATTPYFMDNSFVRGDQMRANNQRIWGNSQSLDTRLTTAEGNITTLQTDLTYEFVKYGVASINPLASLYSQWNTIAPFVTSRNLASCPFYETGDLYTTLLASIGSVSAAAYASLSLLPDGRIFICAYSGTTTYNLYLYDPVANTAVAAGTASLTVATHGAGTYYTSTVLLPNGKVLIVVYASTTTYNLYLYDPIANTAVAAGTASLTVTAVNGSISSVLLPNGKVLIVVYSSTTTYNLYLYDPVANTAVAAGTASLTVTTPYGISSALLPNGKVLIVVYSSTTTYNLYLYDPVANTAVAAGTASLTVTATTITSLSTVLLPNGKVLIVVYSSTTTYNLYLYDPIANTAVAAGTASLTVTATTNNGPSAILLSNGKVLIVVYASTTTYNLYLYDPVANTAVAAGTASLTVTAGSGGSSCASLPNGYIFIALQSSNTAYSYSIASGPFSAGNRYQFPMELYQAGMLI